MLSVVSSGAVLSGARQELASRGRRTKRIYTGLSSDWFRVLAFLQREDIMVHLGQSLMKHYPKAHLVIRFALGGCTNRPYYRIVVTQNKRARDGRYLEQLGVYDPLPNDHDEKIVGLNIERLKYWIACGAQYSKPLQKLLGLSGFFPLHPMTVTNAERIKKRQARKAASISQEEDSAVKE